METISKKHIILFLAINIIINNQIINKTVLTIGGAQEDTFLICEKENNSTLAGGQKIEINNPSDYISAGGGAINSAISFKRLDYTTIPVFKVGNDERNKIFLKTLELEGISTKCIIKSTEHGTGISYIIPSADHDNCILIYRGANKFIKKAEIPYEEIKKADLIYITSLNGISTEILLPLIQTAKKHDTIIALNPGASQIKKGDDNFKCVINNTDILIINASEAKLLINFLIKQKPEIKNFLNQTKIDSDNKKTLDPQKEKLPNLLREQIIFQDLKFNLSKFFKIVLEFGPKIVVITNGSDGVYAATEKNIYYQPSIPTYVVSTTGAGDAFGSCFVATLFKNYSNIQEAINSKIIEDALYYGVINSASVISYLNTTKGLLNEEELIIKATKINLKTTQVYSIDIF